MAVFRVEKNANYTVMSNEHLRDRRLTLKAKGLLSQMLSLPEEWDYSLAGLSLINREGIDAVRTAVRELERAGYIERTRMRDENGRLAGCEYVVREHARCDADDDQPPTRQPVRDKPALDFPTLVNPTQGNPTQLIKDIRNKDKESKDLLKQTRIRHVADRDVYVCEAGEAL